MTQPNTPTTMKYNDVFGRPINRGDIIIRLQKPTQVGVVLDVSEPNGIWTFIWKFAVSGLVNHKVILQESEVLVLDNVPEGVEYDLIRLKSDMEKKKYVESQA